MQHVASQSAGKIVINPDSVQNISKLLNTMMSS